MKSEFTSVGILERLAELKLKIQQMHSLLRGGDRFSGLEDEETCRAFHLMLAVLLGLLTLQIFLAIPLFAFRKAAASAIAILLFFTALASLALLRRHRKRAAAILFLVFNAGVITALSLLSSGVHSPATCLSFVLIILAGWLLGRSSAIIFAAASITLFLVEAILENTGHPLSSYFPSAPIEVWTLYVSFVILAIIPLFSFLEELQRQLSALHESEQRFHSLSNAALEGIMIHNEGMILDANMAFVRMFGYEHPDELIGRYGPDLLLAPESRERILQRTAGREPGVLELNGLRKNGSKFIGEMDSRPIKYRGRAAILVATRDITERKRIEAKRDHLQAQLVQAHRMESIGRLAGSIAHDFNNLLTVIIGYSGLLLDKMEETDPLRETLKSIHGAGMRATGLTQQILGFSRKQVLKPRMLDLNQLLREIKPILAQLVSGKADLDMDLSASAMTIFADPVQLDSVIVNLVVNSRDAMPNGGKIQIETAAVEFGAAGAQRLSAERIGYYVILTVRDSGVGMSKETQGHIFEPFFTTKEAGEGTGLGLAVAHGIVEQSGGSIEVQSEPGKGSTFTVFLPQAKDAVVDSHGGEVLSRVRGAGTVLVAEDDAEIRKFAVAALLSYGYSVIEAESPEQVLPLCNRERGQIELILTDVMMPGLGGREIAAMVRSRWPQIKVLFMSGHSDAVVLQGGMHPDSAFIQKPFSPEQLATKVHEMLATSNPS